MTSPTPPRFPAGHVSGLPATGTPDLSPPPPSGLAGSSAADELAFGRVRATALGRRPQLWWGIGAGAVLAIGLIVVLTMLLTGQLGSGSGPFSGRADGPTDVRPPLARLCPPPATFADPSPPARASAPAARPRTVDRTAGISYLAYGAPWLPWTDVWTMGTLGVPYGQGQYFVTEHLSQGDYLASILSGAVPATVNDSTAIDIECTGRQVAADVRAEYYPQPNTKDLYRDELTTLGGMPAWVTEFRLHFDEPDLRAKDELVGLAVLDVGRPTAAVLYVSIPGTNPEWNYVVDEVLNSVQPA